MNVDEELKSKLADDLEILKKKLDRAVELGLVSTIEEVQKALVSIEFEFEPKTREKPDKEAILAWIRPKFNSYKLRALIHVHYSRQEAIWIDFIQSNEKIKCCGNQCNQLFKWKNRSKWILDHQVDILTCNDAMEYCLKDLNSKGKFQAFYDQQLKGKPPAKGIVSYLKQYYKETSAIRTPATDIRYDKQCRVTEYIKFKLFEDDLYGLKNLKLYCPDCQPKKRESHMKRYLKKKKKKVK